MLGAGSAFAATNAPAPSCMSYSGDLYCYGDQGTTISYTWTMTITADGSSYTSSFSAVDVRGACEKNARYTLSYSYTSGGVNYVSAPTSIVCDSLPPE